MEHVVLCLGFAGRAGGKETACQYRRCETGETRPLGSRSPGGGHGRTLLYSCLENPIDRGAWRATPCRRVRYGTRYV